MEQFVRTPIISRRLHNVKGKDCDYYSPVSAFREDTTICNKLISPYYAFSYGIGTCLMQKDDEDCDRAIFFISKKLAVKRISLALGSLRLKHFDFSIPHRKGIQNIVPDGLFHEGDTAELFYTMKLVHLTDILSSQKVSHIHSTSPCLPLLSVL
uniref:Uncharacterized protein n=1 Tax=Megaselia scalaris TaxID=36166 RepID=T1H2G1_MEGSC